MTKHASLREIFDEKSIFPLNRYAKMNSICKHNTAKCESQLKHPLKYFKALENHFFYVDYPTSSHESKTPSQSALTRQIQSNLAEGDKKRLNEIVSLSKGEIDPLGATTPTGYIDKKHSEPDSNSQTSQCIAHLQKGPGYLGLTEPTLLDDWHRNANVILRVTQKLTFKIRPVCSFIAYSLANT